MKAGKIARLSLLIALAMVFSYVESLVPFSFGVPGIKLGLPNLVVMFALYKLGPRDAAIISCLRVVLISFMFSNAAAMAYSLSGAALSLGLMIMLQRKDIFSPVGVSVSGGVAHNLGQILCAMALLGSARIIYYLPVLLISGITAGVIIGLFSGLLIRRINV